MPYIKKRDRDAIQDGERFPDTPGELNYAITRIIQTYIVQKRQPLNYELANEIVGVLECAKLELYRRKIAPYEDQKIIENGDVW